MTYAAARTADGITRWRTRNIDARLATIEDDIDSGVIGGGSGGPAVSLDTTGAAVNVGSSAPPTTGDVLTATSATTATWQAPSGGAPSGAAGGDLTGSYPNPTVAAGALPLSVVEDQAQGILVGRDSVGNGPLETITLNSTLEFGPPGLLRRAALTGDVTAVAGDNATTIAADAVTNAKMANMAAATIKGRASGAGTGDPTDLSAAQVSTILGLGGAAVLNVGTTAGTVAAGDDARFGGGSGLTHPQVLARGLGA